MSRLLNVLGAATGTSDSETFRNESGVYMKLNNFRRWDPEYTQAGKTGLSKGNKDEERVWAEFASAPEKLIAVVSAIHAAIRTPDARVELAAQTDEPDIMEAEEGRVLTRIHRTRERSRKLVADKKAAVLRTTGKLECEACGFDFMKEYGAAGEGIIDVHHMKPLHTLQPGQKTALKDLALLCANCHRVVHARRKWLTVEEVREARRMRIGLENTSK